MNVERIEAVANAIEAAPEGAFDQADWTHVECGTPSCIAGWTIAVAMDPLGRFPEDFNVEDWAMTGGANGNMYCIPSNAEKMLDLTKEQADLLFDGWPLGNYAAVTPAHAAAVLRHLAATGEVEWERFGPDGIELRDDEEDS